MTQLPAQDELTEATYQAQPFQVNNKGRNIGHLRLAQARARASGLA
jgi:hypothetical protein